MVESDMHEVESYIYIFIYKGVCYITNNDCHLVYIITVDNNLIAIVIQH